MGLFEKRLLESNAAGQMTPEYMTISFLPQVAGDSTTQFQTKESELL